MNDVRPAEFGLRGPFYLCEVSMHRIPWLALILLWPALAFGQQPLSKALLPKDIDAYAAEALRRWDIPGLALAIVHDDRLVYLKGYGVKEAGRPEKLTPDTVFPIASCSKPFTSLAVAFMMQDGKLTWDDPVRKHIPFFRLDDPLADAQVSLRDLLTHRTGVESHELLWYKAPWDLEERIRKIGKVPLDHPFRSGFHYQSILFGASGYAAGKAAGSNWQDLVQKRILGPLEMKSSSPVFPGNTADLAVPHRRDAGGKAVPIPRYPLEQPDPAGSVHASARDLGQFLRFQLGDGTWQGKRLLARELLAEMHMPQMVVRREGFAQIMNPASVQISYGLGWIVQDYRGQRMLLHGGAIDGFRAHFTLLPDSKLGIVLLNNMDRSFMNLAISNTLVDHFLGQSSRDWNAYYLEIQAKDDAQEKERGRALRAGRKQGTKPSLALANYVGKYHDPAYGTCEISLEGNQLTWTWGSWRCLLDHFQDDIFLINQEGMVDAPVAFAVSRNGTAESLVVVGRVFRREK